MSMLPTTWGELRQLAHDAIDERDYELADRWVQQMVEVAERGGEAAQLASAYFSLGVLRHAEGELEAAEEAFEQTVDHDVRAHGPAHEGVAEALRSLGLVRLDRIDGKYADAAARRALATFGRAAEIYAKTRPSMVSDVLACGARALMRVERWDEASREYATAFAAALRWNGPGHERAFWALLGVGEARRCNRETLMAYRTFSRATRMTLDATDEARADMRSRAWYSFGLMAVCLQHGKVEATLAWHFARALATDPEVRASCEARLREAGDPSVVDPGVAPQWRVSGVFGDAIFHLVHPARGHFVVRAEAPVGVGEPVPASVDVEALLREHAGGGAVDALLDRGRGGWAGVDEDEDADAEPVGGYERWAGAVVDALVTRELLELTNARARAGVVGAVAALLEEPTDELVDAIAEIAGVEEIFCDDEALLAILDETRRG